MADAGNANLLGAAAPPVQPGADALTDALRASQGKMDFFEKLSSYKHLTTMHVFNCLPLLLEKRQKGSWPAGGKRSGI